MTQERPGPRFLLWVDAVGGYLVCLRDEILLGQALQSSTADVPILGDLSRRHATIRRQGEGYLIVPHALTRVAGQTITTPRPLADGDELELGTSCVLRFRQPHPLSRTSRLEFLSHHRTWPAADAILLMAKLCVIGPSHRNHVVNRAMQHDLMLVREGQRLRCHGQTPLEIDGQATGPQEIITLNSRISGDDFCISLEQLNWEGR